MSEAVQLNYAGQPIRPGEGYGGRPENIPEGCPPVLGERQDQANRLTRARQGRVRRGKSNKTNVYGSLLTK